MQLRRVLILAQDEAIATMLHDLLEGELVNVEAVTHRDAETAIAEVLDRKPDLVIVDVQLQRFGLDVIERLKGGEATKQTPILALAEPSEGARRARTAGANAILTKPFDVDKLIGLVARFIA